MPFEAGSARGALLGVNISILSVKNEDFIVRHIATINDLEYG